jgi:hypothetical protein
MEVLTTKGVIRKTVELRGEKDTYGVECKVSIYAVLHRVELEIKHRIKKAKESERASKKLSGNHGRSGCHKTYPIKSMR